MIVVNKPTTYSRGDGKFVAYYDDEPHTEGVGDTAQQAVDALNRERMRQAQERTSSQIGGWINSMNHI